MADKTIGQLTAATQLNDQDLLVLEQGGTAKKMAGSVLKQYVVGQGGIDHITLNADYTLTVTYTSGQSWTSGSIRGQHGEDGNTPVITATKSGKVTTIYSDGVAIATINDGEDGQGTGDMLKSVYSPNYAGELASKVDMQAKYTKPSGGIPKTDLASEVQASLGKADNAISDAPSDGNQYARKDGAWTATVSTVNGQTGNVVLNADDVNAAPAWQSSATYAAGAYCIHNGYLWHNTSGASSTNVEPGTNYNVWNVTYSNENLADNPWFTVNQRGQSSYTNGYTVDRWIMSNGTTTVSSDGVKTIIRDSAANCYFSERLETFEPGEYTLSCLRGDGKILSAHGVITDSSTLRIEGDDEYFYRCSFSKHATLGWQIVMVMNAEHTGGLIRAVKLERGSVSTLANDTAPNYAEELAKCQRYFQIFKTSSLRKTDKDDFRPTMRVNPSNSTISIGGTTYYASSADL